MALNFSQRPKAIWWFDGLMLTSMAVSAIDVILNWSALEAEIAADPAIEQTGLVDVLTFGSVGVGFGLYLVLWFFVSVRASKIAKWILAVMALLSLASIAILFVDAVSYEELWLGLTSNLTLAAATAMLFVPGASGWFNPQVSPSIFE